nr:SMC-Scp complex subunit ScpB [Candidatus Sigynarchaeota archaeon]
MAEENNQAPIEDQEKDEGAGPAESLNDKENIDALAGENAEGTGDQDIEITEVDENEIHKTLSEGNMKQERVDEESEPGEKLDFEPDDDEVLDELPVSKEGQKGKSTEDEKRNFTRNQVEAVLFVSGQAVSSEEISVKLGISKKIIEELLESLAMEYLDRSTCLEIAKVSGKYILQLKPEFTSSVKSFAAGGLIREAVMRTLTIIAAKQPIVQSELSKLRSSAGEHIKELLDLGLVRATPKGRSRELVTTDKFADMFGFSRDVKTMKEQIKIYLTAATQGDDE